MCSAAAASRIVTVDTEGALRLHDLTLEADHVVAECGVDCGLLLAQSLHTTAGLLLNETKAGLEADLANMANTLVPRDSDYRHDDMSVRWENICPEDIEFPNGHSHIQHAIFGAPSIVLGVTAGRLVLGEWQRLMLVEFDRPRRRRVFLQALGLPASAMQAGTGSDLARAVPPRPR